MSKNPKGKGKQDETAAEIAQHNQSIVGMPPSQAAHSASASAGKSKKKPAKKTSHVDPHLLSTLKDMGFQEKQAHDALVACDNSFEEALEKLSLQASKEQSSQKPAAQGSKGAGGSAAQSKGVHNEAEKLKESIAQLVAMGFAPEAAKEATTLKKSFDAALDHLTEQASATEASSSSSSSSRKPAVQRLHPASTQAPSKAPSTTTAEAAAAPQSAGPPKAKPPVTQGPPKATPPTTTAAAPKKPAPVQTLPPLAQTTQWPDLPPSKNPAAPTQSALPKTSTWGPKPAQPAPQPVAVQPQPQPHPQSHQPPQPQPVAAQPVHPAQPTQIPLQPLVPATGASASPQSLGFLPQNQLSFFPNQIPQPVSMMAPAHNPLASWGGQPFMVPWMDATGGAQPPSFGWTNQPAAPKPAEVDKGSAPSFAFGSFAATPQWKVGSQCEAKFSEDGVWYTAVIESISPDGKKFKVAYVDYGNSEELEASSLRPIGGASPVLTSPGASLSLPTPSFAVAGGPKWKVGDVCEGCFSEDGVWYLAKIDKISPDGTKVHVTYTEYGNSEELPVTSLRPVAQSQAAPAVQVKQPKYKVGDIVEGCYTEDSVWYKARIDQVNPEGPTYKVTYTEYGNEEVLPESAIRPIPAPISFAVGEKCQAIYSVDGEWYNAVIDSFADGGKAVNVTYTDYGNSETVPLTKLRKITPAPVAAAAAAAAAPVAAPAPTPVAAPAPAVAPVAVQPPRPVQLAVSQPPATQGPSWKVGDQCEACFTEDGVWYAATITNISPDRKSFTVVYPEYGNTETLPASSLRSKAGAASQAPVLPAVLPPVPVVAAPSIPQVKIGDIVEACFTEDNVWYRAEVTGITATGKIMVLYLEYGNSEEITPDRIRFSGKPAAPAKINKYKVGDKVEGMFTEDSQWYAATILEATPDGRYLVDYQEYGNQEYLPESSIRPLPSPVAPLSGPRALGPVIPMKSELPPPVSQPQKKSINPPPGFQNPGPQAMPWGMPNKGIPPHHQPQPQPWGARGPQGSFPPQPQAQPWGNPKW